jgi:hypothetical protein
MGICVIDSPSPATESDTRNLEVTLDRLPFGALNGTLILSYAPDELLSRVRASELPTLDEASIAVRLIISEVGADRLTESQHGLEEALAILHTVGNRLTPSAFDPDNANITPYDGCGPSGSIGTCANPDQYLGMATRRALKPFSVYYRETVIAAADIAYLAWNLYSTGAISDFTGGATVYVHRCGGSAYGQTTYHCDGTDARGVADTPGANPYTGPMVLSSPVSSADGGGDYLRSNGYYNIHHSYRVEYQRIDTSTSELAIAEADLYSLPSLWLPSSNSESDGDGDLRLWLTPL